MYPDRIHSRTSTSSTLGFGDLPRPPRRTTFPFENTTRRKPRRWPLALRFIKGSIHHEIMWPVLLHAVFASLVVFTDRYLHLHLGLPPSIIPSLSIVVGLMLVFRNQTAYARFWDGRMYLSTIITSCRNLARCFLMSSYNEMQHTAVPVNERRAERADTERNVRYLIALLVSVKNHLRGNWGGFSGIKSRAASPSPEGDSTKAGSSGLMAKPKKNKGYNFLRHRGRWRRLRSGRVAELSDLVPPGLVGYEDRGLGVPLQFTALIEGYIKRGHSRGWWNAPTSSQYTTQLNTLVDAYGKMETIRLTPVPVALLIHQKQVLALFGAVLPFAMVTTLGWWAMPISTLVVFTLYGIDGIASQLEDPFGYDRADIDMDALIEDIRTEILVLVDEWNRVGESEGEFVGREQTLDEAAEGRAAVGAGESTFDVTTYASGADTTRLTHSTLSRTSIPEEGVVAADWEDGSLMASGTTAAASASMSGSKIWPRESGSGSGTGVQTPAKHHAPDEGGGWFMPGEGIGKSLSWGNRRYTDAEDA